MWHGDKNVVRIGFALCTVKAKMVLCGDTTFVLHIISAIARACVIQVWLSAHLRSRQGGRMGGGCKSACLNTMVSC